MGLVGEELVPAVSTLPGSLVILEQTFRAFHKTLQQVTNDVLIDDSSISRFSSMMLALWMHLQVF
jgi:hypothetical protein